LPTLDRGRSGELTKRCLKALANRYSDAVVKVDESTANPARICKLYGTMTRKGDSMPDRPHRRSNILDAPEHLQAVPVEVLEALAAEVQSFSPPRGARPKDAPGSSRFVIDGWLEASGLEVIKGPDTYNGGRRWTLSACLFNPEHEKPVIIELPTGALVYKCLHKSCSENDWKALRALIEMSQRTLGRSVQSSVGYPVAPQQGVSVITDLSQIPSVWRLESNLVWSVEQMIAQGSVTLICAESGTGKTWFGYYLAGCVSHGLPVIGLTSHRSKVLYVDGENPLYVVKQRLLDLAVQETVDLTIWGGWIKDPPPNPSSPLVVNFARHFKGLIIYDSLIEFHPGSEQSSTETRAFMRQFRALANMGATVVVLHHTGKAETAKLYRGSSDIKAVVDTAYLLEKSSEETERLSKLLLTCFKGRLMPGRDFAFEFRKGHGFVPCIPGSVKKRTEEIVAEILKSTPGLNQTAIVHKAREQGVAKGEIERCLKNGGFKRQRGEHNSILYALPDEEVYRESRS
jgi:archaellum biogenesis ATPase FlaH